MAQARDAATGRFVSGGSSSGGSGGGGANLGNAYGKITIDTSGVQASMDSARSIFQNGLQGIGSGITSLGDQMSRIGGSLMTLTAPISLMLGKTISSFKDFDEAMTNIQAVTGATADEMAGLSQEILDIGENSRAGPQAVAEAFYDIAGGVVDASARMATLKAAVATAEAGNADLGVTTKALISIMNGYGYSADQAGFASDVLTRSVGLGVGTMDEFASALPQVAGLAASLNIPFNDLGGMMAYLTTKGVSATEASTQLSGMMVSLINPTKDMEDALKALGYDTGQAAIEQLGLVGTFNKLKNAGYNVAQLGGRVEALRGIIALTGEDAQGFLDNFNNGLEGLTEATRQIQNASPAAQLDFFNSAMSTLSITIGQSLAPALTRLLQRMLPVIDSVLKWVRENPELVAQIGQIVLAIGVFAPALFTAGKMLSAVGTLIGFLLSPIGLVVAAVAGLYVAWRTNFLGIRDVVDTVVQYIRDAFNLLTTGDFVGGTFGGAAEDSAVVRYLLDIRQTVTTFIDWIRNTARIFREAWQEFGFIEAVEWAIAHAVEGIMKAFGLIKTPEEGLRAFNVVKMALWDVRQAFVNLWGNLIDIWENHLKALFDEMGQFLGNVFKDIDWSQVGQIASVLWSLTSPLGQIKLVFQALGVDIGQVIRDVIDGITRFFDTLNQGGGIGEALGAALGNEGLGEGIGGFFTDLIDTIQNTVIPAVQSFVNWFTGEALPAVVNFVQTTVIPIIERFVGILAGIWELVRPALEMLYNWFVVEALPAIVPVVEAFFGLLGDIWSVVGPALEKLARWFLEEALPTILNFISTVVIPAIGTFIDILRGIWEIVGPIIANLVDWFVTTGWPVVENIINTIIIPGVQKVIDIIKGIWEIAGPVIQSLIDWFEKTGWPIIQGVIDTIILPAVQGVIDIISGIWNLVKDGLDAFSAGISGVFTWVKDNVIQPIIDAINGIKGAVDDAVGWVNDAAGKIGNVLGGKTVDLGAMVAAANAAQGRDSGGAGVADMPYLIGKGAQPELFVPQTSGQFIPNIDQLLAGAGGTTIGNIYIQMPAEALRDTATALQRGSEFGAAFMRELKSRG